MARLGEHLVTARLLDSEQIERALQAQVLWGGRLGTNLIELGLLDLDGISRALGRQHRRPAALARHFEKSDRELQQRLPAELAKHWSVVPLLRVGPQQQIALAVLDPLPHDAVAQLAAAMGCQPSGILQSIAAEMRVRYHLERVYGVPRPARFLRIKGPNVTPFPQFDNVPVPIDSDAEHAVPITVDDSAHPTGRAEVEAIGDAITAAVTVEPPAPPAVAVPPSRTATPMKAEDIDNLARLIDDAIANATAVEPPEPTDGRDRRSYVRTLADTAPAVSPTTPSPSSVVSAPVTGSANQSGPSPLGRMSLKKAVKEAKTAGMTKTFAEATRSIRRAPNRDLVGELVIDTLQRFVDACDAAVLFVIRGEVAIGWKQFSRTCAPSESLAVPLDQPGLVAMARANIVARSGVVNLKAIDEALMRSLGELRGDMAVLPIAVADNVLALLAITTSAGESISDCEAVAASASAAFARLIRDASR